MQKAVTDRKKYGTHVDSEVSRCDNAFLLHPYADDERLCFSPVNEDSCCHLKLSCQDSDNNHCRDIYIALLRHSLPTALYKKFLKIDESLVLQ